MVDENVRVASQSRLDQVGFERAVLRNKINNLRPREGSTSDPSPPPLAPAKAFSLSGCDRIFSLFSRVMRQRLSTEPAARWAGSVLSVPIFSRPDDCAVLVNFF